MLTEERTEKEVEFLVQNLELGIACGYWRYANKLAELGHEVLGVDFGLSSDRAIWGRK